MWTELIMWKSNTKQKKQFHPVRHARCGPLSTSAEANRRSAFPSERGDQHHLRVGGDFNECRNWDVPILVDADARLRWCDLRGGNHGGVVEVREIGIELALWKCC
jgi:hypothetical protein